MERSVDVYGSYSDIVKFRTGRSDSHGTYKPDQTRLTFACEYFMTDCFGASIVNMSNTASSQLIIVSLHCTKHPLATCVLPIATCFAVLIRLIPKQTGRHVRESQLAEKAT